MAGLQQGRRNEGGGGSGSGATRRRRCRRRRTGLHTIPSKPNPGQEGGGEGAAAAATRDVRQTLSSFWAAALKGDTLRFELKL